MDIKDELDNANITDPSENGSTNGQKRRFMRQPIPKKIKRLRRNRRLRKILTPKNALMSLHELLGNGLSEFSILPEERGFVASVYVNAVQYEGRGPSKMAAKNSASEKALRDIIINRMLQSPKSQQLKPSGDPAQPGTEQIPPNVDDAFRDDVEMGDAENDNDESEVPMLHLASFALHKLFSEWQSEGFEIPDFKIGGVTSPVEPATAVDKTDRAPGIPPKRTQLPENANTMHPTTLLCMMRPATKYVDLGSEGQVPNILHRVGVEVDAEHFIGTAKNKKLARKNAAIDACNEMFGTEFIKEDN
ncbi:double-stranded RNA-specific editase 1-like isoform X2 [Sitodiplosis mosellana]|nr:double-stranded RNA-specific editase 1-like isoform X2 [Sitodiplosis mosellana]